MSDLRPAAAKVLETAIHLYESGGLPPTYDEIAEALKVQQRAVAVQLDYLEERRYISREPRKSRSLRILRYADGARYRYREPVGIGVAGIIGRDDPPHASEPHVPLSGAPRLALDAALRAYSKTGGPVSLAQIASERKQAPHTVGKVLPGLVASGHLSHENGLYRPLRDAKGNPVAPPVKRAPEPRTGQKGATSRLAEAALSLLRLVETDAVVPVPLKGTVGAGLGIEAVELPDDSIDLPASWVRGECFLLRVDGTSMLGDAILPGDYVLVRSQDAVEPGEKAVALLPDETAVLKRVYPQDDGRVRLESSNPAFAPIYADSVRIRGLVLAVLRLT